MKYKHVVTVMVLTFLFLTSCIVIFAIQDCNGPKGKGIARPLAPLQVQK